MVTSSKMFKNNDSMPISPSKRLLGDSDPFGVETSKDKVSFHWGLLPSCAVVLTLPFWKHASI